MVCNHRIYIFSFVEMEKSVDMWAPYKELCNTVEAVLSKPDGGLPLKFVELLKKHKQNFVTLLKNPVSRKLLFQGLK